MNIIAIDPGQTKIGATMNIIAIDPGQTKSGIVIIQGTKKPRLIDHFTWIPGPNPTKIIASQKRDYYLTYAFIEDQYLGKNPDSLKKLARNAGRWQEACESNDIPVKFVAPSTWQRAVLSAGRRSRSEQLDKMTLFIAHKDTGIKLNEHEAAAWCIGRYALTNFMACNFLSG